MMLAVGAFIRRAANASVLLRAIRRVSRESVVCAAIAKAMRPSLAYLGGAIPQKTEAQSRDAIAGMWAIARDSVVVRLVLRGFRVVSNAWRHSGSARHLGRIQHLEPYRRVRLIGWIALIGILPAGVVKLIFEGPWPGLSILIWAMVLAAAVGLLAGPRQVAAAWKGFRA